MSYGLKHLTEMEMAHKRLKHPSVPEFGLVRPKFSDKSANDLTHAVVRCIQLHSGFATRLSSTGTFRADLQKFVPSQQRRGLPDVMGIYEGRSFFCEIKFGKDRLSDDQKEAIADLEKAGAKVFVAHNFEEFYVWFLAEIVVTPF